MNGLVTVMNAISLKTEQIKKRFGGVHALRDGSINIRSREVLALVGANGSGKSTLTKIITGVLPKDDGRIIYNDIPVEYHNPMEAQKAGIMAVYQELSLVPSLTVAQNIWLANEPLSKAGFIDEKSMDEKTNKLLELFEGTHQKSLHPEALVKNLPPDERQIVEILKAISRDPDILILDEATASLDSNQVNKLFQIIKQLKEEGKGLVFVSHRMDEIFRIGDRAVVLRNGKSVGEVLISDSSEDELVLMMVGSESNMLSEQSPADISLQDETVLSVHDIRNKKLNGVSFSVKKGELIGLSGLRGQGQSTLLHTLFGNLSYTGKIDIFGNEIDFRHPKDAMKQDIALIPGDRAAEGLLLLRSILENYHLPSWRSYAKPLLKINKAREDALTMSNQLNLVMGSLDDPVRSLSGGNAQKVVIGKWLLRKPSLLLLDDPTKGVDVGTKSEFYNLLNQLVESGTTILFYSSDNQELLNLCPRVIVMHDGIISADLNGDQLTEANLVSASMGAKKNSKNNKEIAHA